MQLVGIAAQDIDLHLGKHSPFRKGSFRCDDLYDLLLSFANPQQT